MAEVAAEPMGVPAQWSISCRAVRCQLIGSKKASSRGSWMWSAPGASTPARVGASAAADGLHLWEDQPSSDGRRRDDEGRRQPLALVDGEDGAALEQGDRARVVAALPSR